MVLTARGAEQQAQGVNNVARVHQPRARAGADAASRSPASAASPARATARAAASTARRPTSFPATGRIDDPAARAHMAAVWGIAGARAPGRRTLGVRAARRARSRRRRARAARDRLQPRRLRAARAARRAAPSRRSTCSSSRTSSSPRPRRSPTSCCRARSGRRKTGTMTNLEGRVILRRRAADAADGRAHRPRHHLRHRGTARSRRRTSRSTSARERVRRAAARHARAASPTTRASPTRRSRRSRACSGPARRDDHPGTPRIFAERFATPSGRARFHAVRHEPPAEEPDARVSALPHHRARARRSTSRARRRAASSG